jgi:LPXTG-site transpeptidase (sortase) family protein
MWLRPLMAVGVTLTVFVVALLLQPDAAEVGAGGVGVSAAPPSFVSSSPMPATTTRSPTREKAEESAPAAYRLGIPSIGLDHAMSGGGLSHDGTIDPQPGTVMWFNGLDRVRPGSVGTAVIAAHVVAANNRDVFADLADVDVGDAVLVVAADGTTAKYTVTRASAINKHDVTTDQTVWGANTSRSRLAIITCDDTQGFRRDGHRVANFVVIAERQ